LLGEYHVARDSAAGRRRLREALEQRRCAEEGDEFQPSRRGWFFGEDALKQGRIWRTCCIGKGGMRNSKILLTDPVP
jgi:hypothetical protein